MDKRIDHGFAASFNACVVRESSWCDKLSSAGIKACHADDGCVEGDVVDFCYPLFRDDIEIGDLICLGSYNKFRIVRVVGFEELGQLSSVARPGEKQYRFEVIPELENLVDDRMSYERNVLKILDRMVRKSGGDDIKVFTSNDYSRDCLVIRCLNYSVQEECEIMVPMDVILRSGYLGFMLHVYSEVLGDG